MGFNSGFEGLNTHGFPPPSKYMCVFIAFSIFQSRSSPYWLRAGRSGDGIPAGARFSAPVQTGRGAHPAPCTMGTGSFPGVKRPRCDADPSSPSSAVGHERVELYLYSPYGPYGLYRASVPVQGCTVPLPCNITISIIDQYHGGHIYVVSVMHEYHRVLKIVYYEAETCSHICYKIQIFKISMTEATFLHINRYKHRSNDAMQSFWLPTELFD